MDYKVSLCIPTNGVIEWVVPVLKSIFDQKIEDTNYEVIIADNGNNDKFYSSIQGYLQEHYNIVYKHTNSNGFLNQIEAFKLANGRLIKFINHRMKLRNGSLQYLIDFTDKYIKDQPVVFFSNGVLKMNNTLQSFNSFDEFVYKLSYYSSWSAGTAIWNSQLNNLVKNNKYNQLFPHMDIIFFNKKHNNYIIDNHIIYDEIIVNHKDKGTYNLFYAFAVEYPSIILDLFRNKNISYKTMISVITDNRSFIQDLYLEFIIKHKDCSYKLDNYKDFISIFYHYNQIRIGAYKKLFINKIHWVLFK